MKRVGFSVGEVAGGGTTAGAPSVIPLTRNDVLDPLSQLVPLQPFCDRLELAFTGLGAGNTTVDAWLSYDAAGDELAGNRQQQTIERGQTTGTVGGAVISLAGDLPPQTRTGFEPGTLYAWIELNGTGSPIPVVGRLIWRDQAGE